MSVEIVARYRVGSFDLDVALSLAGPVTALFGPSGAGKTTFLNILAGLLQPRQGRIAIDGEVWFDEEAGIFVPPHRRRIGYVFQEGRLFPHLTVRQNLLYGRWLSRRTGRLVDTGAVVALLGIEPLLARHPRNLSGGEQQRVAIGRALLASPRLLLMDEPLASLDAARRAEILSYIERLRDNFAIPIVYVSHAAEEVERLADEIVSIADGRVVALRTNPGLAAARSR
jgi:molybdate transport system ATP-binding protein